MRPADLLDEDHDKCDSWCALARRPSTLVRPKRAPLVACPWCGAGPGEACRTRSPQRRRLSLAVTGCHPARLEAAA